MKYAATYSFTLNIPLKPIIEGTLSTDSIGRVFSCELRDHIIKEIKYLYEDDFKKIATLYQEKNDILRDLLVVISYKHSYDVPQGKSLEIGGIDKEIILADLIVVLLEVFKKNKIPTEM